MRSTPWTPGPWSVDTFDLIFGYNGECMSDADEALIILAPEMAEAILDQTCNNRNIECECGLCEVAEKLRRIGADRE